MSNSEGVKCALMRPHGQEKDDRRDRNHTDGGKCAAPGDPTAAGRTGNETKEGMEVLMEQVPAAPTRENL